MNYSKDILEAGICLYQMLYGELPFSTSKLDKNKYNLFESVNYKNDKLISDSAIRLLEKMLHKDEEERPTC